MKANVRARVNQAMDGLAERQAEREVRRANQNAKLREYNRKMRTSPVALPKHSPIYQRQQQEAA